MKRLNKIQLKLKEVHPDIEIIDAYNGVGNYLLCKNKYGEITIDISYHVYKGKTPTILTATDKAAYWRNYAKDLIGEEYDYSKAIYIGNKTKVEIICKKHGSFQVNPNDHIGKKSGCPKCKGNRASISKTHTTESFIKQAIRYHGDKYDYSNVLYKSANELIVVGCPVHGEFKIAATKHLHTGGCKYCGEDLNKGYYSITTAKRNLKDYKNTPVVVYTVRCYNSEESFYKIGIAKDVTTRMYGIPYSIDVIHVIETNLLNAIFIEKSLHTKLNKYKYSPQIYFGGHTECFTSINKLKI